ncbi:dATP/dGTP pyrophosphohydrolase domain-containing protein [Blastochloris tepida]|uniref:dATP/dGTP diphosphohydrolase MazZ domain-containing protein n=1 Tax=Blastochloris tepida TaxID=2233851 RepID=A0A348FZC1_9HYPH|nr:dATP/dGTP pyrophosphohydrolase domain-containing protein [Blastochloris tepida]BBF92654.1 hypothetical protein BLTE_13390 [Blastochloris tepida]
MAASGWIGVDLDGTLAEYHGWKGIDHIGEPVPAMLDRVKAWLSEGKDVRIFTARVSHDGTAARMMDAQRALIHITNWLVQHLGRPLPITCTKDFAMIELWDDRAVQVIQNAGERVYVSPPQFDLVEHLRRQREFSERTFGPGARTKGVLQHIRKELAEIESEPSNVTEWIDVALLAFDGAWRAGHSPEAIAMALAGKQRRNETRRWPDWRTQPMDGAIEHIR